jgi:hypothetical protein
MERADHTPASILSPDRKLERKMTKVTLGIEHLPLLEALWSTLLREPNPVKQQVAIELLTARHAMRLADQAKFVADSMHKHVLQILDGPAH